MDKEIRNRVIEILNYLNLGNKIEVADGILGLGSIDYKVAEKCAELYKEGYGKYIIFTGNCGKGTVGIIKNTEAENFRDVAVKNGVPEDKIFLDKNAINTYENYAFSGDIIKENNLLANSLIVVQKPYAERRSIAIAKKFYPNRKMYITCPDFDIQFFDKYYESNPNTNITEIINEIVAEIDVIAKAQKVGLQEYQEIPENVIKAQKEMIELGFNKYLVTEEKMQRYRDKLKDYLK